MSSSPQFTRSEGAKSGAESILIAGVLLLLLTRGFQHFWSSPDAPCTWNKAYWTVTALSITIQALAMAQTSWVEAEVVEVGPTQQQQLATTRVARRRRAHGSLKIVLQALHKTAIAQTPTPVVMRNGMVGFCECVRPGGTPNKEHCLSLYSLPGWVTTGMFLPLAVVVLAYGPLVSFVRLFYSEHAQGCTGHGRGGERYSDRATSAKDEESGKTAHSKAGASGTLQLCRSYWELYKFLLRWPVAIQGEGPSNGDGLAQFNGMESLCFPIKLPADHPALQGAAHETGKVSSVSKHGVNDLDTGFLDKRDGISGDEYRRLGMEAYGVFDGARDDPLVAYWLNGLDTNQKVRTPTRELQFARNAPPSTFTDARNRARLRDMFHDKVFCHAFFEAHGAPHPTLIAEVVEGTRVRQEFTFHQGEQDLQAARGANAQPPAEPNASDVTALHVRKEASLLFPAGKATQTDTLIWKPRYSTMGLGVEKFEPLPGHEAVNFFNPSTWRSPSSEHPYVLEEKLVSTEYKAASEWYRCTTLWSWDEETAEASLNFGGIEPAAKDDKPASTRPRSGYIWRTRNDPGDSRIQTDIIGGAYCTVSYDEELARGDEDADTMIPFIGHKTPGTVFDPRTNKEEPLDPKTDRALKKALKLMVKMHRSLGRNLWSIGWDVMVVGDEPSFIEFNINNGFFVADHTIAELYQMTNFYAAELDARLKAGY